MSKVMATASAVLILLATNALADFQKVRSQSDFVSLIKGKKLTRPLVELWVTANGAISGRGAALDVSGNWNWKDGYFCRSLKWGSDDLGYNCQSVAVKGRVIRFILDKGTGQSADFKLR